MRIHSSHRGQSGFSLIEVMIAVIVLATGLLALAALQISLTSSSADAKARSRIASLMASAIDDERASGYSGIAAFTNTACNAAGTTLQKAICTAESDSGVAGIKLTQTVTRYYGLVDASTFTTAVPAASATIGYGDYKQVLLAATWTDATGAARSLGASTIASDAGITASNTLVDQTLTTSSSVTPTVHETNPSNTAGVIPIAVGSNTNAASTNPKPKLTNTLPSTTFNTLTYTQGSLDATLSSTIQKRVETSVTECVCQSSSSNPFSDTVFLGAATFRPTYWNGTQYSSPSIAKLSGSTITPYSAPYSSITQDDLCNQCCRDHHDVDSAGNAATAPLFDSITNDAKRYQVATTTFHSTITVTTPVALNLVSGSPVAATMNGTSGSSIYLDSCRLIRVDGLWAVSSDMNLNHMGLIPTSPKGFGLTSTPDTSSAAAYEDFVIDYIGQFLTYKLTGGSAPSASTIFTSHGLADNTLIIDLTTVANDYRYNHARGLYLDYLETAAITKLTAVNSTCAVANYPTCLLPYLPFNTINVTEIATWNPSAKSIATVTNGSTACTSGAPIRGCVKGISVGTANATALMGHSNSAVASSLAVSPYELLAANQQTDFQKFNVESTNTASEFFVSLSGPTTSLTGAASGTNTVQFWTADLSTSNDPSVLWGVGVANVSGSDYCFTNISRTDTNPDPYDCVTTVVLNLPVNVTLGNYNQVVQNTIDNPCSGGSGTVSQPTLICNTVSAVNVAGIGGGGYVDTETVTGSKTAAETTLVALTVKTGGTINPITKSLATVNVTFSSNGTALGSFTCDATTHIPTFTTPTSCP